MKEVDARPSDAIALALRAQCQILVSDKVVDKTGIQVEEVVSEGTDITANENEIDDQDASAEEIDKFTKLLEGVDLTDKGGESQHN